MAQTLPIKSALISVFDKTGLDDIVRALVRGGVRLLSTGGTRDYILSLGFDCDAVEDLTGYPSILGGRVKTLHPRVFGGILGRRDLEEDLATMASLGIPPIDLVIVDLYPFEKTVASGADDAAIIEKIDIGGISLIRAAAKNCASVAVVASKAQYPILSGILERGDCSTTATERALLAREAFAVSSAYDTAIFHYMASRLEAPAPHLRLAVDGATELRYGENPHQSARFYGDFNAMFTQLHGKEISYNNLLDIDSAVALIDEFDPSEPCCAILKHNNACGVAVAATPAEAWTAALACDPVSAFGGVIIMNTPVDAATAEGMDSIFFEAVIAPDFSEDALTILYHKKNRIVLRRNTAAAIPPMVLRSALNGVLMQQRDTNTENPADFTVVSGTLTDAIAADMVFANKIVKHSKSNAIVLARDGRLLASGVGQTSRVDALKQAIDKARAFGHDLKGATMASDAFFPFGDCVALADEAGVTNVVQPGGSIRDNESVDYCRQHGMTMVMTGHRHFRH